MNPVADRRHFTANTPQFREKEGEIELDMTGRAKYFDLESFATKMACWSPFQY